ncbi:hypothetical protein KC19_VG210900, partial [Ceratodon purpureus]
ALANSHSFCAPPWHPGPILPPNVFPETLTKTPKQPRNPNLNDPTCAINHKRHNTTIAANTPERYRTLEARRTRHEAFRGDAHVRDSNAARVRRQNWPLAMHQSGWEKPVTT